MLMMGAVVKINFEDVTEAIPAFLAIVMMSLQLRHRGRDRVRHAELCVAESVHRALQRDQPGDVRAGGIVRHELPAATTQVNSKRTPTSNSAPANARMIPFGLTLLESPAQAARPVSRRCRWPAPFASLPRNCLVSYARWCLQAT